MKTNSIKSKNISLFKIAVLSLFSIYFNHPFIYLFCFVLLFIDNKIDSLIYICIVCSIILSNNYRIDFIPVGIVEEVKEKYFIVNKLLYKVKVLEQSNIQLGDVLYFDHFYKINKYEKELKNNILFYGNDYVNLFSISIKQIIYNHINTYDDTSRNILLNIFYHQYYDDNLSILSYGLISYYFLNYLKNRNIWIFIISLILYSLLFRFETKFILLILDILLKSFKFDRQDKFAMKIIIVSFLNIYLFNNYSFLLPLLINLYSLIDFRIDFFTYFCLIQSIIFGEINIINSLFYSYLIKSKITLFVFLILLIFIPGLQIILEIILKGLRLYEYINFTIKGSLTILGFLIFLLVIKMYKISNKKLKFLILVLIIISPFNNPLFHVSFIDVGQGDAILIKYPFTDKAILFDTGSKYNYTKLKRQLNKEGIYTIEYLVLSHDDEDHNGNKDNLIRDFNVNNIIEYNTDIDFRNINYQNLYIGAFDNDNDNSLVYLFNIEGINFLLTGDISKDIERVLLRKFNLNDVDVLKVSHHGSYTASSDHFIGSILPKYAIISTSGMYNHPSGKVVDTLDKYGVKTYITRDSGTIKFFFLKAFSFIKTDNNEFVIIR